MENSDSFFGLLVGAMFAAFTALMRILSMPPKGRPGFFQTLGRVGISFAAGWLVGSALRHFYPGLPDDLLWGFTGAAGFFGDTVYLSLGSWLDSRYGTAFVKK